MSTGRSGRKNAGDKKTRKGAQNDVPPPDRPTVTAGTQVKSPRPALVVWGAPLLLIIVLAGLSIFFLLPRVFNPSVDTPTVSPSNTQNPSGGTISPSTGASRIAFVRTERDNPLRSLYVVNADGTNQQRVTDSVNVEGTIHWSPDGNSILMQAGVEGTSTVVRVDIGPDNKMAGSAQLTADLRADSAFPAWSPDGAMIAYQSKSEGPLFQVFVMNADGSGKRRLSDGTGFAGFPTWSPNSQTILYASGAEGTAGAQRELFTVPVAGGEPKQITSIGSSLATLSWSPDGSLIAFEQIEGDRDSKLLLMNSDGSNVRTLDEVQRILNIAFSPDSDSILYDSITSAGAGITIYDLTTERTTDPAPDRADHSYPVWSPDGSMLAWASTVGNNQHKIVVANADGTERRTVSTGDGDDSGTRWAISK